MYKYEIVKTGVGSEPQYKGIIIESLVAQSVNRELSGAFNVTEAPEEYHKGIQFFCNITLKEVK